MLATVEWCWICCCAVYFWSPFGHLVFKNILYRKNAQYLHTTSHVAVLIREVRMHMSLITIHQANNSHRKAAENQMKRQQNELAQSILEARPFNFSKQMSRIISSNASRDFQEHQRCVFGGIVQSWICWYKDSMVLKWCFEIMKILSCKLWIIAV